MYESHFGLTGKPFQLNPDPAFFFGSRGHRRAMAYLEYGLHQSEGFIVITGEVGAGKTTLVRSLLESLDSRKVIAAHLVSTHLDAGDILRLVAAAFGVPSRNLDKADLLLALETFLVSITAAGKRALLIVDEAQNLTQDAVEELRMLSNFQLEEHALLQSFLVGQPEFRSIMQSPQMQQLRQRVIASYHLGPLDGEETRAYIEHRLKHVGWQRNPEFHVRAFDSIYRFTGGIPRRINTLCDRLMLGAYLGELRMVGEADVEAVIAELADEQPEAASLQSSHEPRLARPGNGAETSGGKASSLLSGLTIDPTILEAVSQLSGGHEIQRIESRICQLEQSVSTMVRLLNQLVQSSAQDAVIRRTASQSGN